MKTKLSLAILTGALLLQSASAFAFDLNEIKGSYNSLIQVKGNKVLQVKEVQSDGQIKIIDSSGEEGIIHASDVTAIASECGQNRRGEEVCARSFPSLLGGNNFIYAIFSNNTAWVSRLKANIYFEVKYYSGLESLNSLPTKN